MARIKKLTEEEKNLKQALSLRVLSLYREKRKLNGMISDLDKRIEHLEGQVNGIGGPGIDVDDILKTKTNEKI